MRNDYSVGILNHRMDDALGMNDNLNAFRLEIKKPASLDNFQALIHQRRRVNGNFLAHRPVRMMRSFFNRDIGKVLSLTERPARASQKDIGFTSGFLGRSDKTLKNSIVFAVDRHENSTRGLNRIHQDSAAANDTFLIGQQKLFTGFGSLKCRRNSGSSDDSSDHDIDFGAGCDFINCLSTGQSLRPTSGGLKFILQSS